MTIRLNKLTSDIDVTWDLFTKTESVIIIIELAVIATLQRSRSSIGRLEPFEIMILNKRLSRVAREGLVDEEFIDDIVKSDEDGENEGSEVDLLAKLMINLEDKSKPEIVATVFRVFQGKSNVASKLLNDIEQFHGNIED